VGVEEIRWNRCGAESAGEYTFLYGKGKENHELGTGFTVRQLIISAFKRVEFVNGRMSCIILRGRWCDVIFLNVHVPREHNIEYVKDGFYQELESLFKKSQNIACQSR
jgi:hypothetical protein